MKKIYIIDTWRRIKSTIVTYFSIMLIICLGISSYLGITFAGKSMKKTGDKYYSEQKFHDFEITSNLGIGQEEIKKLKEITSITNLEGVYKTTGFLKMEKENRLVTIQSITNDVDIAKLISGKIPIKENEIAIEKVMAGEDKISIGDYIDIDSLNEYKTSTLLKSKFKVVGIVEHPTYACNYVYGRRGISEKGNGNSLNFFLVSEKAFNKDQLGEKYQSALLWSDELDKLSCFSNEYKKQSKKIEEEISKVQKQLTILNRESMLVIKCIRIMQMD